MTPPSVSFNVNSAIGLIGLPNPLSGVALVILGVILALFLVGLLLSRQPRFRARIVGARERANDWILQSIADWERDGRITADEAAGLREELARPDFAAVLPHFGVHLTIGLFLRFPIGSIMRASYTLLQILAANARFLTHRMDRRDFQLARRIHTPLVLLVTCVPGIGTFAYLASQPFRANHLLLRATADAVLLKLPVQLYERIGLRGLIARPLPAAVFRTATLPGLHLRGMPAVTAFVTLAIAGVLLALDLVMDGIDETFTPNFLGWSQLRRITGFPNEASLATWYQVTLLFLCAVALAVITIAAYRQGNRYRRHWAILAVIVLGFSIDEQAKFHDAGGDLGPRLREMIGYEGPLYYGWAFIALACALVIGLTYWKFLGDLPATTRFLFIVAGGLYVTGEAGIELLNGWLVNTQGKSYVYQSFTLLEELFGMLGTIVALVALLTHIESGIGTVSLTLGRQVDVPGPTADRAGTERLVVMPALPCARQGMQDRRPDHIGTTRSG